MLKRYLKKMLKSRRSIIYNYLNKISYKVKGSGNIIGLNGKVNKVKFEIIGNNNLIHFGESTFVVNCLVYIKGDNHKIVINDGVHIYGGELWLEDKGGEISIGSGTSIQKAHLAVTENNRAIRIGADCMLSTGIEIRTGDSHSIIDVETGARINKGADVIIEDQVWVGSRVSILKGVTIGANSIVGTGAIVVKSLPVYCLAAGVPARVVKTGVTWGKERIE